MASGKFTFTPASATTFFTPSGVVLTIKSPYTTLAATTFTTTGTGTYAGLTLTAGDFVGIASGGRLFFEAISASGSVLAGFGQPSNITSTSGNTEALQNGGTFAAAAGSGNFAAISPRYTINNPGAQTGTFGLIWGAVVETALNGMAVNLIDVGTTTSTIFSGYTSKFKVDNSGNTGFAGTLYFNTAYSTSSMSAPANGIIRMANAAGNNFTRLIFGSNDTGAPGLVKSGTDLLLQLGDGSDGGRFLLPMGTGTGEAPAIGTANVNTTAVGNVGAGTDDLMTYSHPANSLSAVGKGVRITAWGTAANNANAKTVTLAYGATTLVSTALTISQAGTWSITAIVIATGGSTQEAFATLNQGGAATLVDVERTTPGETLTGAVTIKCTGTATTTNDIVQEGLVVEMLN